MSRWSDQFEKHQIHETVRQIRDWAFIEIEGIDSDHEMEQRRLLKVIDTIKDLLESMDPEFYPEGILNSLDQKLKQPQVWNELSAYSSDGNVQHIRTANDHLTGQIPTIYQLASFSKQPESRKAVRAIETAYDDFCKSIEKAKKEFEEEASEKASEIADLESRTTELNTLVDSLKTTTDTQIATWEKEFTEAQTSRIKEHSDAEIARSKEYEAELQEFKDNAEKARQETTKKHDDALKAAFDGYAEDVQTKTAEINTKHEEILTLHGLVTTDGVAGGYKKGADEEWWAATIWSGISMVCYGLILLWVIFKGRLGFGIVGSPAPGVVEDAGAAAATEDGGSTVVEGVANAIGTLASNGIEWPLVVTTLSVTAVAILAAQYAGRQSRVHRMNEQRLRWFSFEIAAIDPFIASLPPEKQKEMKANLAEKLFGQDRVVEERPQKVRGVDSSAMKTLLEELKEIIKTAKG